ncbi:hypothetical protein GCM10007989_02370 [Devosia pacifica]|uniref:DUF883 domain-containing protein n=1 Tax=Devosia pacifica TaxID=1335967 RepID=A0A918RSZ6_9HYPH|nr:SEC61-beta family protein [Devosia pacifica]GHA11580.1 hypothetical protein GCM10007989_02370 [Devosia pacifica]
MNQFDRAIRDISHGKTPNRRQLEKQIATLQRDLEKVSRDFTRTGEHRIDEWSTEAAEFADELHQQINAMGRELSRYADKTGRAIKKDPVPVLVGAGVFALIVAILLGRR